MGDSHLGDAGVELIEVFLRAIRRGQLRRAHFYHATRLEETLWNRPGRRKVRLVSDNRLE